MGVDFYLAWTGEDDPWTMYRVHEKAVKARGEDLYDEKNRDETRRIFDEGVNGEGNYIRESYGGSGPFATVVLCPEAFLSDDSDESIAHLEGWIGAKDLRKVLTKVERIEVEDSGTQVRIDPTVLLGRLPAAMKAAKERYGGEGYGDQHARRVKALAEKYARLHKEGRQPTLHASW